MLTTLRCYFVECTATAAAVRSQQEPHNQPTDDNEVPVSTHKPMEKALLYWYKIIDSMAWLQWVAIINITFNIKQACCAGCRRRPFPMQLHQQVKSTPSVKWPQLFNH